MTIFKSTKGSGTFEFQKTDAVDENGSLSLGFSWKASSKGFSSELNDIWFYDEDLETFAENLEKLADTTEIETSLEAMSDFKLHVTKLDQLGNFKVQIEMKSPVWGNHSCIVNHLDTSSILSLAKELRDAIQK